MSKNKFPAKSRVRVNAEYPDTEMHGREGILCDYSDDRKPRAVVVFLDGNGEFETTRFLFDNELEAA